MSADVTLPHRVGKCPACRDYLWAEVDVRTSIGDPRLSDEGKAVVSAYAEVVAMRLTHECAQDDSADTT